MPYVYIGLPSLYGGKPLFHILNNLKNFGVGRIVYKSLDYENLKGDDLEKPSFYRILFAQPEMDSKNLKGRVVAERVFKGLRYKHPVNISEEAEIEDFRLVPKIEEASFCKWAIVKDYLPERDSIRRPKYMEMAPTLKEIITRNRAKKGQKVSKEDLYLPAYKVYEGDHVLENKVESNDMFTFIEDSKYKVDPNFDMDLIPTDDSHIVPLFRHFVVIENIFEILPWSLNTNCAMIEFL